jgi:hypothetical protein
MTAPVLSRSLPWLTAIALAPFSLLERVRGRRRLVLLAVYGVVLTVGATFVWRAASLRNLPEVEPFDVEALKTVRVADDENAYVLYREAARRYKEPETEDAEPSTPAGFDWSTAAPDTHRWVEANREALEAWLRGTERPQALNVPPREIKFDTPLWPTVELRALAKIALLEGSRREQAGDLEGAWTMYRAALRCSRHVVQHGSLVQRLLGVAILQLTRPRIQHWVERPRLTAPLLRRARQDVDVCRAMTPPPSVALQLEYLWLDASLDDPAPWKSQGVWASEDPLQWSNHLPLFPRVRRYLRRESERNHRVLRLVFANLLAQCDRPTLARPRLRYPSYVIYDTDAATPPAVRALGPEGLRRWVEDSDVGPLLRALDPYWTGREPAAFEALGLAMALRAYALDHGNGPRTYGDLLGPYLKSLPDCVQPEEPAPVSAREPGVPAVLP